MAFLISPIRAICPTHLFLDVIVFIIKSCCFSLCYFIRPVITFFR